MVHGSCNRDRAHQRERKSLSEASPAIRRWAPRDSYHSGGNGLEIAGKVTKRTRASSILGDRGVSGLRPAAQLPFIPPEVSFTRCRVCSMLRTGLNLAGMSRAAQEETDRCRARLVRMPRKVPAAMGPTTAHGSMSFLPQGTSVVTDRDRAGSDRRSHAMQPPRGYSNWCGISEQP